jgi:DNA-directed RNA polymerase beta subunit
VDCSFPNFFARSFLWKKKRLFIFQLSMDIQGYELRIKRIVESYLHFHGFASHQLESYEHFLHFMLPDIIREHSPISIFCPKQKVIHRIFLSNMCIKKPTIQEANGFIRQLSPKEAHLRKQTYCIDVFVDVIHKVYKGKEKMKLKEYKIYRNVLFCKIPCMLNSSGCHDYQNLDRPLRSTGTFIINGYEKVLITQEKLKCNYPYVFEIKRPTKYTFRCEIRSFHSSKIRSTSTLNIHISAEKATSLSEIALVVPFIKHHIPLPVIFRLLDVCDLETMMYYIVGTAPNCSQELRYKTRSILCNDTSNTIDMTPDELCDWIGLKGSTEKQKQKRIQYIRHETNLAGPGFGNRFSKKEQPAIVLVAKNDCWLFFSEPARILKKCGRIRNKNRNITPVKYKCLDLEIVDIVICSLFQILDSSYIW